MVRQLSMFFAEKSQRWLNIVFYDGGTLTLFSYSTNGADDRETLDKIRTCILEGDEDGNIVRIDVIER